MKTIKQLYGLRHTPDELSTLEGAKRYAERCVKLHVIVLGDNCKFWVVCLADAIKLKTFGYETI
jgi:hypothetical protein